MDKKIILIIIGIIIVAGIVGYFVLKPEPIVRCGDRICQQIERQRGTCPRDCESIVIETCQRQGGNICSLTESCSGSWLDASDTDRCCSEECESGELPELDVPYSFFVVHIKRGADSDYTGDFNYLKALVGSADSYNVKLTLQFSPQWVDYILENVDVENIVRSWQDNGHEISIAHPGPSHLSWDGYTNMPEEQAINISYIRGTDDDDIHELLGSVNDFLEMANQLAYPEEIKSGTITNKWTDVPDIPYLTAGGGSRNRKAVKQVWNSNTVYTLGIGPLWDSGLLEAAKNGYETLTEDEIFGVVTHNNNFVGRGKEAIEGWFEYLSNDDPEGIKRKTVTEIMEEYMLPNNLVIEDDVCGDSYCDDTERFWHICPQDCARCVFPSDCAWCTDKRDCPECGDMRVCEQGTSSIFYNFVFG